MNSGNISTYRVTDTTGEASVTAGRSRSWRRDTLGLGRGMAGESN